MTTPRFPQGPFIDPQISYYPTIEWVMWLQNPEVTSIVIGTPIDVPDGGTGLTSGTSGGILGFTSSTTMASSVSLTADALIVGGGPGATPTPLASLGTVTTLLHGNASGEPFFASVDLNADTTGILEIDQGGTNSESPLDGQAIMVSDGTRIVQGPKGITTKVLHGNASGIPQYQFVVEGDQFLTDNTTWDVSITAHGYVPKAPNDAEQFLNGVGAWATPAQITSAAVEAVGYWSPLTNGDPVAPELIFDGFGDTISVWTPTP